MAALVTGLIPIVRTAVDATTNYKCRSLWFGTLCIRLVILFLAELPFTKVDADFTCNTTRSICIKDCFNRHFHKPMMVAWNFIFVLVVISVLLMEMFTSHLRSTAQKRSTQAKTDVEQEAADTKVRLVLDLHKDRGAVLFYLLSITLRILTESWFVYVLLCWNLPALSGEPFKCPENMCHKVYDCVLQAAPEKRMSIYALASISGGIIVCLVLFCMYSIVHYLCEF